MTTILALALLGQCSTYHAVSYAQPYAQPYTYYQQQAYYYPTYKAEYFAAVVGDKLKAEQIQEKQTELLSKLTERLALLTQTPSTVPAPVVAAPPVQAPVYAPPQPVYQPLQTPLKSAPAPVLPSPQQPDTGVPPPPLVPSKSPQAPVPNPPTGSNIDQQAQVILAVNCASCHTGATAKHGYQIFTAPDQLNAALTPFDRLKIRTKVRTGEMPPPGNKTVSSDDYRVLESWLDEVSDQLLASLPTQGTSK